MYGYNYNSNNDQTNKVNRRIEMARLAFVKMREFFTNYSLALELRTHGSMLEP